MFNIIFNSCFLLLAILGLTTIVRYFALIIVTPKYPTKQALLVMLDDRNAELQLRAAVEQTRWLGKHFSPLILAVDCGLDETTRDICVRISEQYYNIVFCESKDLDLMLTKGEFQFQ